MQRPSRLLVIVFIIFAISLPYSLHTMETLETKIDRVRKDVNRLTEESETYDEIASIAAEIATTDDPYKKSELIEEYNEKSDEWNTKYGGIQTAGGSSEKVTGQDIRQLIRVPELAEERPPQERERKQRIEEEKEVERRREREAFPRILEEEQRAAVQKETELRMREEERRTREVESRTREAEEERRVEEEEEHREDREVIEETITEETTPTGKKVTTVRRTVKPTGVNFPNIGKTAKETDTLKEVPIPESMKREIEKKERELEEKERKFEEKKRKFDVELPEFRPTTEEKPFEPTQPYVTPEYPETTPYTTPTSPVVTDRPFDPTQPSTTPTPFGPTQLPTQPSYSPTTPGVQPPGAPPKDKWWKKKPRGYQTAQEFDDDWNRFLYDEEGMEYLRSLQQPAQPTRPQYGSQNKVPSSKRLYVMYGPSREDLPYQTPSTAYPQQPVLTSRIPPEKMRKELEKYERSYLPELLISRLLEIGKKINKVVDRDDVVDFIGVVAKLPDFFRLIDKKRLADIKAVDLEGKRIKEIRIFKHQVAKIENGEIPTPIIKGYAELLELVTEKNKILKGVLESNKPLEKKIKRVLVDYKPDFQRDLEYRTKAIKRRTLGFKLKKTETGIIREVIKELNKLYNRYDKIRKYLLLKGKISSKDASEYVIVLSIMYNNILEDPEEDVVNSFAALVKKTLGEGSFLATFLKDPKWWRTSASTKFAKYKLQTIEDIKTDIDLHKIQNMKKTRDKETIDRLKATQDLLRKLKGAPTVATETGTIKE